MCEEPRSLPRSRAAWRESDERTLRRVLIAALLVSVWWYVQSGGTRYWVTSTQIAAVPYQPRIDVNRADWPELCLLPGVGETRARAIVAHRQRHGPFRRLDDLRAVPGVGPKTITSLRNLVWTGNQPRSVTPSDITPLGSLE